MHASTTPAADIATLSDLDDAPAFTTPMRDALEAVRLRVAVAIDWPIHLEFGTTEDGGEHWAALTVEELPPGALGRPGLLVSVLVGPAIPGCAVILSADGRNALGNIASLDGFKVGLSVAETEAAQMFAAMLEGAAA
jgi:hypothetical protein